jgi:thioredoxin reductase
VTTSRTTSRPTSDSDLPVERVRVAIIGGGPSGLTAAAALAGRVDGEVRVLDREDATGGIPRHSHHLGYGVRDLHRFVSGPAYARRLTDTARDAGAQLHVQAQVTGWAGDRRLLVTSPRGRSVLEAEVVVLATGARERPRAARRIPGDRPDGVYTTGELQNLVHLGHAPVGRRAVVIGAELVSWSAVLTLRNTGCRTVAMTTAYERSEAYLAFRLVGRLAWRTPVLPRTRVVRIDGRDRVASVLLEDLDTGERRLVGCDTVVTTGDWVPDHELVRLRGLDLDRSTLGPVVDTALGTSAAGVFAVGNLVHPVDTADGAALDGRQVAVGVQAFLDGRRPASRALAVVAVAPFRWVTPQRVALGTTAPRGDLLLWCDGYQRFPVVRAVQDGRVLARRRLPWPAAPGRVFRVPADLVDRADADGGPVAIGLERRAGR